ncbi:hypothetical protein DNTS_031304 [Danionella cerebrum]|uniref:Uncharacterized protein n=1 Tax=Danionella cerebrum TaxID=2873325 RepID=A0A553Q613_9TELE|nr:hypothetical protein DNTS_031304 [Danionella translucida]
MRGKEGWEGPQGSSEEAKQHESKMTGKEEALGGRVGLGFGVEDASQEEVDCCKHRDEGEKLRIPEEVTSVWRKWNKSQEEAEQQGAGGRGSSEAQVEVVSSEGLGKGKG